MIEKFVCALRCGIHNIVLQVILEIKHRILLPIGLYAYVLTTLTVLEIGRLYYKKFTQICVEGNWKTILEKPLSVHPVETSTDRLSCSYMSGMIMKVTLIGSVPTLARRESGKTTLSTLDQDLNLDLPVIGSLVYCESSALNHAATEVSNGVRGMSEKGWTCGAEPWKLLICPHEAEFAPVLDPLIHREIHLGSAEPVARNSDH
uniref:Uncharacterized protein n=1 Tax=Timema bartmani TaxID=61472 RepID=A0A7R9F858_9NEOP|nr:unnamed protein product [Timema bartmani]